MDYQAILEEIHESVQAFGQQGTIAQYIPQLAKVDPDKLGISLLLLDDTNFHIGDAQEAFSIQSIAKTFALAQAMSIAADEIWARVDVEPSGGPFNSLILLEYEKGIPRNPFINSGAIVIADILISKLSNPKQDFLAFVRQLANDQSVHYNESVALSEKQTGFRNIAVANLIKSFGNIHNDVTEVLDFYFHMCSIEMSCDQLAKAFQLFANHGVLKSDASRIISSSACKRLNAIMQTCGFYDEAGEFAFRVGLPGKSGVGGGIAAVLPASYSIVVWSPRLNGNGNSVLGMKVLESFTTLTGHSIF